MMVLTRTPIVLAAVLTGVCAATSLAAEYTIHEIQYTTAPDGSSDYIGQTVDCTGGIVVAKFPGFKPRVMLQDPDFPDAWGGIQVKDWSAGFDFYNAVAIGDDITLTNVTVEEYRGNTLLQWYPANSPGYSLLSHGNEPPPPVVVTADQIPGPICTDDGCYVENHDAEPFEAMRVVLYGVTVGQKDLGKAEDNYELLQGADISWGADYMNIDVEGLYHPRIETGVYLVSITGLLEQYTKQEPLWYWDYYQLCTLSGDDVVVANDVPAVSARGLMAMLLLAIAGGAVVLKRASRDVDWRRGGRGL